MVLIMKELMSLWLVRVKAKPKGIIADFKKLKYVKI